MTETWLKAYFLALAAGYADPSFVPDRLDGPEEWAGELADDSEKFLDMRRKKECKD